MSQGNSCEFASLFGFNDCKGEECRVEDLKDCKKKSNLIAISEKVYDSSIRICANHSEIYGKDVSRRCSDPTNSGCKGKADRQVKSKKYLDGIKGNMKQKFEQVFRLGSSQCRQCHEGTKSLISREDAIDLEPSIRDKFQTLNAILKLAGLDTRNLDRRNKHGQKILFEEMINDLNSELKQWFDIDTKKEDTRFQKIVERVNEKIESVSTQEAVSLLTLFTGIMPQSEIMQTFDISKRQMLKVALCFKEQGILGEPPKKKRKGLDEEVLKAVEEFYMSGENCRISPNTKDVVSFVDFQGNAHEVSRRHLLMTTSELHSAFLKQHPNLKIGRASFQSLRPSCCFLLGDMKKEVCVCTYHDNLEMMFKAIGIRKYNDFLKLLVCDSEDKRCMFRRCANCTSKDDEFKETLKRHCQSIPNLQASGITFQQWCSTDRTTQVHSHLEFEAFIDHAFHQSNSSLKHHLVTKAQSKYYQLSKSSLDHETVLLQGDFSENYSVCYPKESQNLHFKKTQVTLHPFVAYFKKDGQPEMFTFLVVSDSLEHTAGTFFTFKNRVIDWVKDKHPSTKRVLMFTDGAASHYKNRKTFANVLYSQTDLGVSLEHHFYASCHGKGPCDGIGGTAKAIARRAAYGGKIMNDAPALFDFLSASFKITKTFYVSSDEISNEIAKYKLEDRYKRVGKIPGIRSVHCVKSTEDGKALLLFELSCDNDPCGTVEVEEENDEFHCEDAVVGDWIVAFYKKDWYFGKIEQINDTDMEFLVAFLKGKGANKTTFSYFEKQPIYVTCSQVICKVTPPVMQMEGRINKYVFNPEVLECINSCIAKRS